jgi:adenylate cyclase
MLRPFKPGDRLDDHAAPIGDVLQELRTQLAEYRAFKEQIATNGAGITGASPSSTATDLHYTPDFHSSASSSSFT